MYRTNRSSLSNNNKPFLLKPAGKDYLWGGNRLNRTRIPDRRSFLPATARKEQKSATEADRRARIFKRRLTRHREYSLCKGPEEDSATNGDRAFLPQHVCGRESAFKGRTPRRRRSII